MVAQRHDAEDFEPAPRYTSADELGLLGSMLFDPERIPEVMRTVSSRDFADLALKAAFTAIIDKHREADGDGSALAVLVLHTLRDSPFVDNAQALLADIADAVATGSHAPSFAKKVSDASLKRRIVNVATEAAKAASNGRAGSEVLADLLSDVGDLQRNHERRSKFPQVTLGELRRSHPDRRPFVVDGLVREGETMNIIAAPKVGKSWLIYSLLLSIANNERWLGRFDVAGGKVWLLDNELHAEELRWRLDTVAEAMGIPPDVIDREVVITSLRGNMRSLRELETDGIEPGEFKLIVGDACYRFATMDGDENSNTDQTKFFNLVDSIADKTTAAIALVHHASKGDQSGKSVTDVGAGGGAQSRAADCHLVIRPHEEEGCAVVNAAVRSFAPLDPLTLRWAWPVWIADDHLDPNKLAGRLGKGQQARAAEDAADKQTIITKLAEADEPLSMKGIREVTGFGKDKTERLVYSLMAEGLILKGDGIVGRQKCNVYMVPDSAGTAGTQEVHTPSVPPGTGGPEGGGGVPIKDRHTPSTPSAGTPAIQGELIGHEDFHDYATGGAA